MDGKTGIRYLERISVDHCFVRRVIRGSNFTYSFPYFLDFEGISSLDRRIVSRENFREALNASERSELLRNACTSEIANRGGKQQIIERTARRTRVTLNRSPRCMENNSSERGWFKEERLRCKKWKLNQWRAIAKDEMNP